MDGKPATVGMSCQPRFMFHDETVQLHLGRCTDDVCHLRYVIGMRSLGHPMQVRHKTMRGGTGFPVAAAVRPAPLPGAASRRSPLSRCALHRAPLAPHHPFVARVRRNPADQSWQLRQRMFDLLAQGDHVAVAPKAPVIWVSMLPVTLETTGNVTLERRPARWPEPNWSQALAALRCPS